MEFHLIDAFNTIFAMLDAWDWSSPFHLVTLGYFIIGAVAQFVLLQKKWKTWLIPLVLLVAIVLSELGMYLVAGEAGMLFAWIEVFFAACALGAAAGCIALIFWDVVKKKKD